LPLAPIFLPLFSWMFAVILIFVYMLGYAILGVAVVFHLISNIRLVYRAANSDIMAANFVTRACGIKSIIHTFKRVVWWRRHTRYTMNTGYVCLSFVLIVWMYKLSDIGSSVGIGAITNISIISIVFFLTSLLSLVFFEIGRNKFTSGMDPTLALVLMVEEIGGQLLAFRQTKIVGTTGP
jgi:hypothetical protein